MSKARTDTYHEKTKAEYIADMEAVCEQIKLVRAGKLKGTPIEEFLKEL